WADEIHGTSKGFETVAARFKETIEGARARRRPPFEARRIEPGEQAIIVLDPGHGGEASVGGSSANNATGPGGTLEKTLTLQLGITAEQLLQARGHRVFMTRKSDRNLSLAKRAQVARDNAALVFVSIHFNGWHTPRVQGTETFHHPQSNGASQSLTECVHNAVQLATGLQDRGVKTASFGVLRPTRHHQDTAACLLEVSFLTDPAEEIRLTQDPRYLERIAHAIANGVEDYLDTLRDGQVAFEAASIEDIGDATEILGLDVRASGEVRQRPSPNWLRSLDAPKTSEVLPGLVGIADPERFLDAWRSYRRGRASLPNRFEMQIGIDNSLPIGFLDRGASAALAVARIRTSGRDFTGSDGAWFGTGFLVAPNMLLTNNHVLNSTDVARRATVEFGLRDGPDGRTTAGATYSLDPSRLFVTSPAIGGLDYTFVHLAGDAHERFGFIGMQRGVFTAEKDERANVIHHPGGRPKRVSLQDNRVLDFDPQLLHYTSDTEGGSSGAPVFDNTWRLIALHHAWEDLPPGTPSPDGSANTKINEGIKLSAITIDLETRASHETDHHAAQMVLDVIEGSDSIVGFFGARGRSADSADALERVVDAYKGTAEDIDVAFWNVEWFNRRYRERVGDVARIVADLNLDIWAFAETSPKATEALVDHLEREFGHKFDWAASEPEASSGKQTTTVIWNPLTVRGRRMDWPDEIEPLLTADSRNVPNLNFEAVDGLVFNRYPSWNRVDSVPQNGTTPDSD
ncbi:MAG: N-acetylmuramoyl-L-alanine amidase, partial [Pseudomonadota bacterium]